MEKNMKKDCAGTQQSILESSGSFIYLFIIFIVVDFVIH